MGCWFFLSCRKQNTNEHRLSTLRGQTGRKKNANKVPCFLLYFRQRSSAHIEGFKIKLSLETSISYTITIFLTGFCIHAVVLGYVLYVRFGGSVRPKLTVCDTTLRSSTWYSASSTSDDQNRSPRYPRRNAVQLQPSTRAGVYSTKKSLLTSSVYNNCKS